MSKDIRRALMVAKNVGASADDSHPATQIPGVHISERTHGKPIFTEERAGRANGGRTSKFKLPSIRPSSDDVDEVLSSNMDHGRHVGPALAPLASLSGGVDLRQPDQRRRVDSLKTAMASPNGYISRLIVDDAGNVLEGQHRLEALRELGAAHAPVHRIADLSRGLDMDGIRAAINRARPLHPDHVTQLVNTALDNIHDEGGSVQKVRDNWEPPRGFEEPYNAVLDEVERQRAVRPAKADGGTVFPDEAQADEGITAYQGGPHSVGPEGYDNAKIGTGEGAQGYGYGHYFAEHEPVAKGYRDDLSKGDTTLDGRSLEDWDTEKWKLPTKEWTPEHRIASAGLRYPRNIRQRAQELNPFDNLGEHYDRLVSEGRLKFPGHMHQVLIKGKPEHFLDHEARMDEQSDYVKDALKKAGLYDLVPPDNQGGRLIYLQGLKGEDAPKKTAEMLAAAGIKGIKFLDEGSRGLGKGTRNYVVFDPKHIDIQRRYNQGGSVDDKDLFSNLDRTKTGYTFKDVAPKGGPSDKDPTGMTRAHWRMLNSAIDQKAWKTVDLPIRAIYASQHTVNPDFSGASERNPELPLVFKKNGNHYLMDGHHRLTAAAASGKQTAPVRLIDLDGGDPKDRPLLPLMGDHRARGGMAYADGGSLPDAGVQKALDLTRDLNPQGLYSHAAEAAMASPQAKGPLPQMLASLKGVKPDELKYSGVNEQFASQPRVTREELAQHFQQGLPNIQETTLREGGTAYQGYTLPGGENYREILLHLPDHSATPKFIDEMTPGELRGFIAREDRNADFDGLDHDQLKNLAASIVGPDATEAHGLAKAQHSVADVHYNSHWPKHNVLAHLRLKDRTGPNGEKILHAEEVQSDWGQDARRAGTYDAIRPYQVFETNTGKVLSEHATPEEAQVESAKHRAAGHEGVDFGHAIDTHTDKEPVPNGPYIGSTQGWTDLALKRLLHEAATGGYDKVVYTPGAEQGRRYNVVQRAEAMRYFPESGIFQLKHPHDVFGSARSGLSKDEMIKRYGRENIERLLSQPLNEDNAHELRGNIEYGGEGMKGYYDKVVPKSLLALAKQHDPDAKLEGHEVTGLETPTEEKDDAHQRLEERAGGDLSIEQAAAIRDYLDHDRMARGHLRLGAFEEAVDHAMRTVPDAKRSFPGLTITPRMRESILKKGFKAYARGGDVEGFKDGGSPDDDLVRQRLAAIPSVTHPDPEMVQKALAIAAKTHAVTPKYDPKAGQSYYNFNTPTDISDVQSTVDPIPGVTPLARQEKSWEDLYKEGKGGTMINLGGDRSRLGRLTHIQGKALAWPVDLHAGPDYMREPNEGAVWANAANQSGRINKLITRLQDKGPVYGAYTPMGPKTVDSSVQMSDALMSQIAAQKPDRKMMKEFDAQLRAGFFADKPGDRPAAAEAIKGWPGIEKAKEARDFLAKLPGTLRSLIVKHMDKAGWHKAGFPHVGMTRVALTDPELLKTSGNMVGHRIVQISADDISPSSFKHNTYPEVTAGKYVGDVPLVQRHYAFPEAVERFAQTPHTPGVLHPYSENPNARSGFKKMTEEQKVTQTLDEPWMERLSEGLENQKKYGLSKGGTVKDRSVVDDALRLTSKIRPAAAKRR